MKTMFDLLMGSLCRRHPETHLCTLYVYMFAWYSLLQLINSDLLLGTNRHQPKRCYENNIIIVH